MAHPRLQRRASGWFARIAVPLPLRPVLGKHEIVRSLRTNSHKEAVSRLHAVSIEANELFRTAAKQKPVQPVAQRIATEAEIVALVRAWFWNGRRQMIAKERAAGPHPDPDQALQDTEFELGIMADPDDPYTLALRT